MATVPEIISDQQAYVTSWQSQADAFINKVADLANTEFAVEIPDGLGFGVTDITSGIEAKLDAQKPVRPTFPELDVTGLPEMPTFEFTELTPVAIPEFTSAAPSIAIPTRPSSALPSSPTAPSISDVVLPSATDPTMPVAPAVTAVSLPIPPSVYIPSFDSVLPIDDLVTPTNSFAFAEEQYASLLLDALKSKLLSDLQNGGYGIETADEQALFDRARSREYLTMLGELELVAAQVAARGFPIEPGELSILTSRTIQRTHDKVSDVNREITLERSRLYNETRKFTIQEVRQLEQVLINYHNAVMERALNAAKATLDAAIAIFNTQVARYNTKLDAYKTEAQVFAERVRAILATVEIYKTQVEAANLELDVQKTAVEIYKAQLDGVKSVVDIYRARVEAANVQAALERTRIEAFRGLVDAYAEQVRAKVAEFNMYEATIRGETAKLDAYRAEVEAFRARADAAKASADVLVANATVETERARAKLAAYEAASREYNNNLEIQTRNIASLADIYRADVAAYGAAADAIRIAYSAQIQEIDGNIRWNVSVQDSKVKVALAELEKLVASARVRLGASEFGSDFYKSIVAATLGSINTLAAQIENA